MTSSSTSSSSTSSSSSSTIFIGSLDANVHDALLFELFSAFGVIKSFKIIRDSQQHHMGRADPYGFVEYNDKTEAAAAIAAMHRRLLLGKNIRVSWARNNVNAGNVNSLSPLRRRADEPYTVFVGDLGPDVDSDMLTAPFRKFGVVVECRVVRDLHTGKSRGFGFVSYANKKEAQAAIDSMQGQRLDNGGNGIRVNWAVRRGLFNGNESNSGNHSNGGSNSFDQVFSQASSSNCTVYCGSIGLQCDENALRKAFLPYGRILEVRLFKDKGYAFIRFDNKESACNAIVALNNEDIFQSGQPIRCAWGREENSHHSNNTSALVSNAGHVSNHGVGHLSNPGVNSANGLPQSFKLAQNQAYLQQQPQFYGANQQPGLPTTAAIQYVMPYGAQMATPQLYDVNQGLASLQQLYTSMGYYNGAQPAYVDANQAFLQDPNNQQQQLGIGQQQQQQSPFQF